MWHFDGHITEEKASGIQGSDRLGQPLFVTHDNFTHHILEFNVPLVYGNIDEYNRAYSDSMGGQFL